MLMFQKTIKNKRLRIEREEYWETPCPIEDWDTIGTMYVVDGRRERLHATSENLVYPSRDELIFALCDHLDPKFSNRVWYWENDGHKNPRAQEYIEKAYERALEKAIIYDVDLYVHSGSTIRFGPFNGDYENNRFDGLYVCSFEKVKKEYGNVSKRSKERARKCMVAELGEYKQYLEGDVYAFIVKSLCPCCGHEKDVIDSCGGFYGDNWKKNGVFDHVPEEFRETILNNDNEVRR